MQESTGFSSVPAKAKMSELGDNDDNESDAARISFSDSSATGEETKEDADKKVSALDEPSNKAHPHIEADKQVSSAAASAAATAAPAPSTEEIEAFKDHNSFSKTFPQRLMDVLSSEDTNNAIVWMPDGLSFVIISPRALVADVLPRFFKAAKFASVTRKLNRWGFKRITNGENAGAYYHELFQRDNPDLCIQMRCRKPGDTADSFEAGDRKRKMPHDPDPLLSPTYMPSPYDPNASLYQQHHFPNIMGGGSTMLQQSIANHPPLSQSGQLAYYPQLQQQQGMAHQPQPIGSMPIPMGHPLSPPRQALHQSQQAFLAQQLGGAQMPPLSLPNSMMASGMGGMPSGTHSTQFQQDQHQTLHPQQQEQQLPHPEQTGSSSAVEGGSMGGVSTHSAATRGAASAGGIPSTQEQQQLLASIQIHQQQLQALQQLQHQQFLAAAQQQQHNNDTYDWGDAGENNEDYIGGGEPV